MSKQRYLYVEGQKIPVSEELYKVYYHFARKEQYFSEDLKREKLLYDTEQQIAVQLPSCKDSYERLLEQDKQFSDPSAATPEDDAVKYDNRCIMNGILWIARTGAPWRTLPERYGKWQAVYARYRQWKQLEIFEAIFAALSADADMENLSMDSTSCKVHQSANGGEKR